MAEDVAPIFINNGQIARDETIKIATNAIRSLVFDFLGLTPFGPQPNQPQIPPAIKIN